MEISHRLFTFCDAHSSQGLAQAVPVSCQWIQVSRLLDPSTLQGTQNWKLDRKWDWSSDIG